MPPDHPSPRHEPSSHARNAPPRKLRAEVRQEEMGQAGKGAAPAPVIDLWSALSVGTGGALGSLLRYLLAGWANWHWGSLPLGILIVNVSGSFAIGLLDALTGPHGAWPTGAQGRRFFMVGVCGGYTTYSSFALLTLDLALVGSWLPAAANVALSFAFCLAATVAGQALGSASGRSRKPR